MQGWIELKNMDRAMDLFNQMENKRAASMGSDIHLADQWLGSIDGTNGHGRESDAELMNDLMSLE